MQSPLARREGPSRTLFIGADDGIRTRDPHLGKVMLYQLSHVRAGDILPTQQAERNLGPLSQKKLNVGSSSASRFALGRELPSGGGPRPGCA